MSPHLGFPLCLAGLTVDRRPKMNPEFRQTLNTISHNLESANQAAQENIYTFTQLYIDPCLSGLKACIYACTAPCFPNREDNLRRKRGRSRGRAEYSFDFYDAWDDDDDAVDNVLAWGNDELDSLLAGRGALNAQPARQRAMSYGSRGRRKPGTLQADPEHDPTVIPSSSYLGFLERLPWKIGSRTLRYKPSAAGLQEHPGKMRVEDAEAGAAGAEGEAQPLLEADEHDGEMSKGPGRQRSGTAGSRSTMTSRSSRGDLIFSDEDDDAVPLDDEFAVMLTRRMTNAGSEDQSSGKTGASKPTERSRRSTRTVSSKSTKSVKTQRSASSKSLAPLSPTVDEQVETSTMTDFHQEEEQARREEEMEIQQKREAAHRLAVAKGLSSAEVKSATAEAKADSGGETPAPPSPAPEESTTIPVREERPTNEISHHQDHPPESDPDTAGRPDPP